MSSPMTLLVFNLNVISGITGGILSLHLLLKHRPMMEIYILRAVAYGCLSQLVFTGHHLHSLYLSIYTSLSLSTYSTLSSIYYDGGLVNAFCDCPVPELHMIY